jgi:hypothetical protein
MTARTTRWPQTRSQLRKLVKSCPAYVLTKKLAAKYDQQYRVVTGRVPLGTHAGIFRNLAMTVALRKTMWLHHEATTKLMRLQSQNYYRPYPTAYIGDKIQWR